MVVNIMVRFGIPPTDIKPGFHVVARSAGKMVPRTSDPVDISAMNAHNKPRIIPPIREKLSSLFIACFGFRKEILPSTGSHRNSNIHAADDQISVPTNPRRGRGTA